MSTLARLIVSAIVAIFMTSCNFDLNIAPGIKGDGNVVVKNRKINTDFDAITVSRGIEVYITQGYDVALQVEADKNLHDIISTEVENGVLKILSEENIKSAEAKIVHLTVNDLNSIATTSGAYVQSDNKIKTDLLTLNSTSGSHIDLDVSSITLNCQTTSGAGIKLSGTTENLKVAATSGSYIKASDLQAGVTKASATSGASISLNTSEEITANANSGGSIKYTGNPEKVTKNSSVSGSIRQS